MAVNNRVKITNDIELKDRLVAINRVTKVTKGGRTFSFSANSLRLNNASANLISILLPYSIREIDLHFSNSGDNPILKKSKPIKNRYTTGGSTWFARASASS